MTLELGSNDNINIKYLSNDYEYIFSTQQKCQPQYMKYYAILKFATNTKQFMLTCELAYVQNFKIKSTILLLRPP